MHIITLTEGDGNFLDDFQTWVRNRRYDIGSRNAQQGVQIRELKAFNITLPMEWKEAFLKDLGYFNKPDLRVMKLQDSFLWQKSLKKIGINPFTSKEISSYGKSTSSEAGNPRFWVYNYPVGIIEDKFKGKKEMY